MNWLRKMKLSYLNFPSLISPVLKNGKTVTLNELWDIIISLNLHLLLYIPMSLYEWVLAVGVN